jgi:hypothetical protein
MQVLNQRDGSGWTAYHGDSCEVLAGLPDNSIHYSITSIPFASLYTYSNSDRDLGNCLDYGTFAEHYSFLCDNWFRVTIPGRLVSIHCMNLPAMKERDGFIGVKDFRGDVIRWMQKAGFIFHSEVCIWKDPLVEATRTKALGLLHRQIMKDSAMCRQGLPDYVVTFRKPGANPEPIAHPDGFTSFIGNGEPAASKKAPDLTSKESEKAHKSAIQKDDPVYSHQVWRRYASPVWMDISQSATLQKKSARAEKDERHICPLQLPVIGRCIELWSNPGDVVLDPFSGIGSTGYQAIQMGRRHIAIELKESYFQQTVANLWVAEAFLSTELSGRTDVN